MSDAFKVAAVEFNPRLFDFEGNLKAAVAVVEEAAQAGARLIVLPEACLSGYIYADREQFLPYMDEVPGRATDAIGEVCAKHGCYVAFGLAEIDKVSNLSYNTGALVGPKGYIGKYRKVGLNPSDIKWFMPGNTGHPVFETELGNICMIICYDDTYWEPARLPAIKGADIIAYICSSDRVLTELGPEASGNHSTIATVQQLCAWNGLAMVAADRNNAESNPTTGVTVTYGGSASIWQADGERTAHSPATKGNTTIANPGSILYGELDPARFDNDQRKTLADRRPELYTDLTFFRAPTDTQASTESHEVELTALQYRVIDGDFDGNLNRAEEQFAAVAQGDRRKGLLVLPAGSFSGLPPDKDAAAQNAENENGRSVQVASDFAARSGRHVIVSYIHRDGDSLSHRAVLVAPNGRVIGGYNQTHVGAELADWCTPGEDLPVYDTEVGRVGMLLDRDVQFPEASGVLAVRRADLIGIPTSWQGQYGGHLHDSKGLFEGSYPSNTMCLWYAIAKTAQAYTVVANRVDDGSQGSSGVFSLNPIDADEPPLVGAVDDPAVVTRSAKTKGSPKWWMDQHKLIGGRRPDLAVPLTLPMDSDPFRQWQQAPGFAVGVWAAYKQ